tara:strand:+ start:7305 stop:8321 length:1017 start_codon:yes stop_codon:yes gene_type:complete
MKNSYLVCKVDKDTVHVIIDGLPKSISRSFKEADQVVGLAEAYNLSRDNNERDAIIGKVQELLTPGHRIQNETDGRFEFDGGRKMYLKGTTDPIPNFLAKKLMKWMEDGIPLEGLVNFWKHLLLNPDKSVRKQLYSFLEHNGHPITDKGYFLAYKACKVKSKYDKTTGEEIVQFEYNEDTGEQERKYTQSLTFSPYHSGAHGMVIKVGQPITMPRDECDSNPERTCSSGLHVGSMEYVHDFGYEDGVILEVLVSPRNVVAVPSDYDNTKMRCCEYFPIAINNGENENIYLESDYSEFNAKSMRKDLKEYEEAKRKQINDLEAELAQNDRLVVEIAKSN